MSEAKRRRVLKAKNVRYLPNKIVALAAPGAIARQIKSPSCAVVRVSVATVGVGQEPLLNRRSHRRSEAGSEEWKS